MRALSEAGNFSVVVAAMRGVQLQVTMVGPRPEPGKRGRSGDPETSAQTADA
jgi:hypothetical protein